REAADWLASHPGYHLVVAAHTDAVGTNGYNAGLAARRARIVRDELAADGIAGSRVILVVFGKACPPSRDPYVAANRVAVIYATTLSPQAIAKATLQSGDAVLWTNPGPPHVAIASRGSDVIDALAEFLGESPRL